MYLRTVHAEGRIPFLRQFVRENPLGLFTTAIPSTNHPFIQTSHIPWLLDVADEDSETELGVLRGHMARANPQCKTMVESLTADSSSSSSPSADSSNVLEQEVLVLFNGPVHSYVTPKFYVETKPSTAKVVPTWNYSAVQAYGRARIFFDPRAAETSDFLARQVADLSHLAETSIMGYTGEGGRPSEWKVSDAPENYVELLKKAIIGIEVTLTRLEGKFKMSQEMGQGDREGVIDGFTALGTEGGLKIAETVRQRGELKDLAKSA